MDNEYPRNPRTFSAALAALGALLGAGFLLVACSFPGETPEVTFTLAAWVQSSDGTPAAGTDTAAPTGTLPPPTFTSTAFATPTDVPTASVAVQATASLQPTATDTATPAPTATATDTATPVPTATETPTPVPSPTPTVPPPPTATPVPVVQFPPPPGRQFGTLEDFWNGGAEWILEVPDTGLPMGESDTVYRGGTEFWSYLHASHQSAGVVDQCGAPVPFPGCTTLWRSTDGGQHFVLENPVCLFPCAACPCEHSRDHIGQQQYPRVFFAPDQAYLVYEFGAYVFLRTSSDGLNWSQPAHVPGTWIWWYDNAPCSGAEEIGAHPHIYPELEYNCLVGGPPGLYVEGNLLYVFVALGRAPGHMGCFVGNRYNGAWGLSKCASNPLLGADLGYGPVDALGPAGNPYFEFRTVSSADVVRVGERYYMLYEGVRGPSNPSVPDDQFGLGLARSAGPAIDGPWEKYPGNPIVMDLPGNIGLGHADIVIVGEATYLYTTTPSLTRGRYALVRR
jgi:hypothetical protein